MLFHVSIWGAWSFVWGVSPPKPPHGDGTDLKYFKIGGLDQFI